MSQPPDYDDLLRRLMRNQVDEAEMLDLVQRGRANVERRKSAARRRTVEVYNALIESNKRLDELHREAERMGHERLRASVTVEIAQINIKTQMRVAELNRLLSLVPGLHDEVLNQLANDYEASDAQSANAQTDEPAAAEAVKPALDGEADQ